MSRKEPADIAIADFVDLPSPDQFRQNLYDKTIRHLFDPVKKFMISRLNPDMATMIIRLHIIAKYYQLPQYSNIADLLIEKSISINGKSRDEILALVKNMSGTKKKDSQNPRLNMRGQKNAETESYEDE